MADGDITQMLRDWVDGDARSLEQLTPLVYEHLRRLAASAFRGERAGHTLQPTALVHEAYARLVDADVDWQGRSHFYALAARTMRRILVDYAEARRAEKRGGQQIQVTLQENLFGNADTTSELLALDEALAALAELDARKAEILELHYFGGLTYDEMSAALSVSTSTLDREMRFAKAWLKDRMSER